MTFDVFRLTRLRVIVEFNSRDILIFVWFMVVDKKSTESGSAINFVCVLTGCPIWSSSTVSHSLSSTVFKSAQLLKGRLRFTDFLNFNFAIIIYILYLISFMRFLSLSFCIWDAHDGSGRIVTPTAFLPRSLSTSSTIDSFPAVMTIDFGLIGDWLHVRFDVVARDWLIVEQSRSLCRFANALF